MHSRVQSAILLLLLCAWFAGAQSSQQCLAAFRQLNSGFLCVRSDFTRTVLGIAADVPCAIECIKEPHCRAFTTVDGPCQLFVFDKCSKSVRDCGCSRRGRLFVKRQSGLEPGALCPSGYGDDLCGVKYRLVNDSGTWSEQKVRCESEPGLVIMADVTDSVELSHLKSAYKPRHLAYNIYLGGYRVYNGQNPTDGWIWLGCNTTVGAFVWQLSEPNNGYERATAIYKGYDNLVDVIESEKFGTLCECLSPFS